MSVNTSLRSFDELRFGFSIEPVYARLIHSWEIRNLRENSPMGLEMLFIDAKAETIIAFIPACHMAEYKSMLRTSTIYKLNQFMVVPSRAVHRVSTSTCSIRFTEYTMVAVAKLTTHVIDEDLFRLRIYEELANIADENSDLFDVMGRITLVTFDASQPSNEKVHLHLQMEDGQTMRVAIWDEIAKLFRDKWFSPGPKSNVFLITTINPKHIGGALVLNSTSSSRIFFDNDLAETRAYRERLSHRMQQTRVLGSSSAVTKVETVTIAELHEFLAANTKQTSSFYCVATILGISEDKKWFYVSCPRCQKKEEMIGEVFVCTFPECKNEETHGVPRFRFEAFVGDETSTATFLIVDSVGQKIAGQTAAALVEIIVEDDGAESLAFTPQCFKDLIGHTKKFEIRVIPDTLDDSRHDIIVTRIFPTAE